jgi:hypothetical protein
MRRNGMAKDKGEGINENENEIGKEDIGYGWSYYS